MEKSEISYKSSLSQKNREAEAIKDEKDLEKTTSTPAFASKIEKKRDSLGIGPPSASVKPELLTKILELKLWQLK